MDQPREGSESAPGAYRASEMASQSDAGSSIQSGSGTAGRPGSRFDNWALARQKTWSAPRVQVTGERNACKPPAETGFDGFHYGMKPVPLATAKCLNAGFWCGFELQDFAARKKSRRHYGVPGDSPG